MRLPISLKNRGRIEGAIEGWRSLCHRLIRFCGRGKLIGSYDGNSDLAGYVALFKGEPLKEKPVKLICFYLPQFHSIPENDQWWGEGFTEWVNVRPAQPQFHGHYQPHIPIDPGYYNLLDPLVQRRQIELAQLYGIGGFCFYFYWFGGKRLLEAPLENYLRDTSLDFPFCLCWANENWGRRWDGLDSEILIAQNHSPEDDIAFIKHVSRYMRDPRYIRIGNKPLLLVYRPGLLPSATKTAQRWRAWCAENGIGEIYIAYTQSFEKVDPVKYGFDAAIEFPPNNSSPPDVTRKTTPIGEQFNCSIYDWEVFVSRSRKYQTPNYKVFRGVCPAWDNTARRKNKSTVFLNSSPLGYQEWLHNAVADTCDRFPHPDERLVFINAWNEWAEGAHLEPDQRYGYSYLEATRMALVRTGVVRKKYGKDTKPLAIIVHAFYEDIFDEIVEHLKNIHSIPFKLYVTTTHEKAASIRRKMTEAGLTGFLLPVENRGRDILPFFRLMPYVLEAGHDFLIKVHTKKSMHREDGEVWRRDLFEKLLPEKSIELLLNFLDENPKVGILGPTGHLTPMRHYFGSNALPVLRFAARLGVNSKSLEDLSFVAGSMFIARVEVFHPIFNLALDDDEFEPELAQVDGTLAHAIERLFAVSAFAMEFETTCIAKERSDNYAFAAPSRPDIEN